MVKYIIKRLLQAIPLLFIISLVLFMLLQASGDPLATLGGRQPPSAADRERLERRLGLDQPPLTQYVYWLIGNDWVVVDEETGERGERLGVLRGDFGNSLVTRQPVLDRIGDVLGNTLLLMIATQIVIVLVSLVIGIVSALKQYSWVDNLLTTGAYITLSFPIFLMALLLMYIFALQFRKWGLPYFPVSGMYDPLVGPTFAEIAWHMVLPVTSIALISIAGYTRYIRSTMLEVIQSDYIRTARSKGVSERRILFVHALKNASLPLVTLIGLDLPFLLAGAVVTETIFAWPGMGRLFIDSLRRSDFSVLMGILVLISVAVVFFQIVTDIVYTWLDPRIRY